MDTSFPVPNKIESEYTTGLDYWMKKKYEKKLATGFPELNELLDGGFSRGMVTILYGSRKPIIRILLNSAINALLSSVDGGMNSGNVVYVDAENSFNPYYLSEKIRVLGYQPETLLKKIDVSRVFNWNQMVEIMSEKVPERKPHTLIVSGYTSMFEYSQKSFEDLQLMNAGIKSIMKYNPVVVLGTRMHFNSEIVPMGGKVLSQFGGVLVSIVEKERHYDFTLQKHPAYPTKSTRVWKETALLSPKSLPRSYTKDKALRGKHLTLDTFVNVNSFINDLEGEMVKKQENWMKFTHFGPR